MNSKKIYDRLMSDYSYLQSLGYEVVGVFLQGSQNYELDYEGSDIDTKAIILPSLEDIILGTPMVSTTLILDTNEHIDVKDIRKMFESIKKQNINFMEILFTDYLVLNNKYSDHMEYVLERAETIARMDEPKSVNCMCGMAMEKFKALCHPYPSTIDKIEKFGYDPKQLHHIVRMEEFLRRFLDGEKYSNCLISNQKEFLLTLKKGDGISLEQANDIAKEHLKKLDELKIKAKSLVSFDEEKRNHCSDMLDECAIKIITKYLKTKIKES